MPEIMREMLRRGHRISEVRERWELRFGLVRSSDPLSHFLQPGDYNDRGFPGSSDGKASVCNVGAPGSIPGSGRSDGEGNGNPFQYSCLENPVDWILVGYSLWGRKELATTERLHFTSGNTGEACASGRKKGRTKAPTGKKETAYWVVTALDLFWPILRISAARRMCPQPRDGRYFSWDAEEPRKKDI